MSANGDGGAGSQRKRWEKGEPVVPKLNLTSNTPTGTKQRPKHDPAVEIARLQQRNREKKRAEEAARTSTEVRQKEKEAGFSVYLRGANKGAGGSKSSPQIVQPRAQNQPRKRWGEPGSLSARDRPVILAGMRDSMIDDDVDDADVVVQSEEGQSVAISEEVSDPVEASATADEYDPTAVDPEEDELYTSVLGLSSQDLSHLRESLQIANADVIIEEDISDNRDHHLGRGPGGILPHLPQTPPSGKGVAANGDEDLPISVGILPHLSKPVVSRPTSSAAQRKPVVPSPKEDDLAISQAVIQAVQAENMASARASLSTAPAGPQSHRSARLGGEIEDDENGTEREPFLNKTLRFPFMKTESGEVIVPTEDSPDEAAPTRVAFSEPSKSVAEIGVNTSVFASPQACDSPVVNGKPRTIASELADARAGAVNQSGELITDITKRVQRLDRNKRLYLMKMLDRIEAAEAAGIDLRLSMSSADFSPAYAKYHAREPPQKMSQELTIRLLSTWGSHEFIGLTEIEIFAGANNKITVIPENVDCLGDVAYVNHDPDELGHLVNARTHTIQPSNMWRSRVPPAGDYLEVAMLVPTSQALTAIKIWNYNHMQNLDYGVKEVQVYIDERPVWQGEITRGCGNQIFDYATTVTLSQSGATEPVPQPAAKAQRRVSFGGDEDESREDNTTPAVTEDTTQGHEEDDDDDSEEDVPIRPFGKIKLQDSVNITALRKAKEEATAPSSSAKKKARFAATPRAAAGTPDSRVNASAYASPGTPDLSHVSRRSDLQSAGSHVSDSQDEDGGDRQNTGASEESDVPIKPFGKIHLVDSVDLTNERQRDDSRLDTPLMESEHDGDADDVVEEDIAASQDINNLEVYDGMQDFRDEPSMESFSFARFNVMDSINLGSARRVTDAMDVEKSLDTLAQFGLNHLGRLEADVGDISVPDSVLESRGGGISSPEIATSIASSSMTDFNLRTSFEAAAKPPPMPISPAFDEVFVAQDPAGCKLEWVIHSSWGDRNYVGLTGIDLYDQEGKMINVCLMKDVQVECSSVTDSDDPRVARNLFDGVSLTSDELHSWLAPFTPGETVRVTLTLPDTVTLSMMRVWNHNTSRAHSQRGARHIEVLMDDSLIFRGEVEQASGDLVDAVGRSECIVFTEDPDTLEALATAEEQYTLTPWGADDDGDDVPAERPVSRGPESDGRGKSGSDAAVDFDDTHLEDVGAGAAPAASFMDAQVIHMELLDTWGDGYYMGLSGLEVRDERGNPIPLQLSMLDANPRDINSLEGFGGGDYRTLDKLIDGVNIGTDDRHMWLIPFTPGTEHRLRIDLGRPRRVGSLRFWNYNKTDEDTTRGVKKVMIVVDNKIVSPPGGFVIRKAPGNALFDHGFSVPICEPGTLPTAPSLRPSSGPPIPGIDHNKILQQEYETLIHPTGSVLRFNLFTTHGDPHYIGLDGIEVYDGNGNRVRLDSDHVTAYPVSVTAVPSMQDDIRVPANLLDSVHGDETGSHSWLAPLRRKPVNTVIVWFDSMITLSAIRLHNYSRTPARGVCEFDVSLDGLLIYRGQLPRSDARSPPSPLSLVFTDKSELIDRERDMATYRVRSQDVTLYNEGQLLYERTDLAGDVATVERRPGTSVRGAGAGGRLQGVALS